MCFELLDGWLARGYFLDIGTYILDRARGGSISLLMQGRQLRISQIQASRATRAALMQIGLNNLTLAAAAFGFLDADWLGKATLVNWQVRHWQ